MVRFTKITRDILKPALNATILATFVLVANGTSVQFAKSIARDTRNTVALSITVLLVPHPHPHCLRRLNLTPFPLLTLTA